MHKRIIQIGGLLLLGCLQPPVQANEGFPRCDSICRSENPDPFAPSEIQCNTACTLSDGVASTCGAAGFECSTDGGPPPDGGGGPPPPPDGDGGGGPPPPAPLLQGHCVQGFVQIESLCITEDAAAPISFANAQITCRRMFSTARVATYADYRFIFLAISGISRFNPDELWLGDNFTGDDKALFGNRAITSDNDENVANFDGEGSRFDRRGFRCAYDLIPTQQVLPPAP